MENYSNDTFGIMSADGQVSSTPLKAGEVDFNLVSRDQMTSNASNAVAGITSFETLKRYARGRVVRFPDFAEDMPFIARVRRPSILALAKFGKIPNDLLKTAGSLFVADGNALDSDDPDMLSKVSELLMEIAKASLIEPTYEDVLNAGLEFTDEQLMAIFNYSQSGVEALKPFREQ